MVIELEGGVNFSRINEKIVQKYDKKNSLSDLSDENEKLFQGKIKKYNWKITKIYLGRFFEKTCIENW